MKVIRKEIEKDGKKLDAVEMVEDNKHLRLSMSEYGDLSASFFYDDKDGSWFQESFDIEKKDGDIYRAVDGVFLSYSGDVFFDTRGANLVLLNNEGSYKFFFMKEFYEATNEITCEFDSDSMENSSMHTFFDRLNNISQEEVKVEDKPIVLSKTLKNIIEK